MPSPSIAELNGFVGEPTSIRPRMLDSSEAMEWIGKNCAVSQVSPCQSSGGVACFSESIFREIRALGTAGSSALGAGTTVSGPDDIVILRNIGGACSRLQCLLLHALKIL